MSAPSSLIDSPSDNNGVVTRETFDTLKRKYSQLVCKSGKKQRNPNNPAVEERARGIRKVVSLYTNISTLVAVALAQEEGGDLDTNEVVPEEEQKRHEIE